FDCLPHLQDVHSASHPHPPLPPQGGGQEGSLKTPASLSTTAAASSRRTAGRPSAPTAACPDPPCSRRGASRSARPSAGIARCRGGRRPSCRRALPCDR